MSSTNPLRFRGSSTRRRLPNAPLWTSWHRPPAWMMTPQPAAGLAWARRPTKANRLMHRRWPDAQMAIAHPHPHEPPWKTPPALAAERSPRPAAADSPALRVALWTTSSPPPHYGRHAAVWLMGRGPGLASVMRTSLAIGMALPTTGNLPPEAAGSSSAAPAAKATEQKTPCRRRAATTLPLWAAARLPPPRETDRRRLNPRLWTTTPPWTTSCRSQPLRGKPLGRTRASWLPAAG
mmetsp:Transcript_2678/g.7684  ORF Transcript_2678/g.7684 Transcript_2678/m.7684 type:complete len:236 (+) Transcript_2678:708-1415(+)